LVALASATADAVIINGTDGDDFGQIAAFGTLIAANVSFFPFVNITGAEGRNDTLTVNTLGGNDGVDAFDVPANLIGLTINGGAGNDTILASQGNDVVNGGDGDDIIDGVAGNDTIAGGGGNDTLTGGAGNDTYRFDADLALGSDTINEAGGGIDTLDFSATTTRAVTINLGLAAAQVINAGLTLALSAGNTIENVLGGALSDTLVGNALNNVLTGGSGNDTLTGGSGSDTLTGGSGNDTYRFDTDLALGSDTINEAGGGVDTLDFSATTTRAVTINLGLAAARVINAGLTLTLSAGNTIENVLGGALSDTLVGNALNNSLTGGAGNDTLTGGSGNDTLTGGAGNDTYRFDTDLALGSDTINEAGGGVDTLDFSATTTRAVTINLGLAAAQVINAGLTLTLSAGNTIENVLGGALSDTLVGNALNNSLTGGAGNDMLNGGAGTDTLDGGAGTDVGINGELLINIP
jgi:Ca2+-binding RTX toxin-like protein